MSQRLDEIVMAADVEDLTVIRQRDDWRWKNDGVELELMPRTITRRSRDRLRLHLQFCFNVVSVSSLNGRVLSPVLLAIMMRATLLSSPLRIPCPQTARLLNSRIFTRRLATQQSNRNPNDSVQWINRKQNIPVAPRRHAPPTQHGRPTPSQSMASMLWLISMLNEPQGHRNE